MNNTNNVASISNGQTIVGNQQTGVSFHPTPWTNNQPNGGEMVITLSTGNIIPSLLRAKANMGSALKDSSNPFFKSKYADLNAVKAACEPALAAEKIGVFQPTIQKDGKSYVRTLLFHESGEYFGCDTEIVCAKQNDPQALGSAITYARRYGLQSLVGLGAEDDDGESAMNRSKSTTTTPATKYTAPRASFKKPATVNTQTTPAQQTHIKTEETPEGWE